MKWSFHIIQGQLNRKEDPVRTGKQKTQLMGCAFRVEIHWPGRHILQCSSRQVVKGIHKLHKRKINNLKQRSSYSNP
nr:hypothetical protein CFP56_20710 [Quercus suber]